MLKVYSSIDNGSFTVSQKNMDAGGQLTDYKFWERQHICECFVERQAGRKMGISSAASFTNNKDNIHFDKTNVVKKVRNLPENQFVIPIQ